MKKHKRLLFEERVDRRGPDECWPWRGHVHPRTGYGMLFIKRQGKTRAYYAHRLAWIYKYGPIPAGLTIDHVHARGCTTKLCCNTDHMELVSLKENGRRGNVTRWVIVRDETTNTCRHGHMGELARTTTGSAYCRACNRERQQRRRRGGDHLHGSKEKETYSSART